MIRSTDESTKEDRERHDVYEIRVPGAHKTDGRLPNAIADDLLAMGSSLRTARA